MEQLKNKFDNSVKQNLEKNLEQNVDGMSEEVKSLFSSLNIEEKRLFLRKKCESDLFFLNNTILKEAGTPPLGTFHKEVCNFVDNGGNNKLVLMPRLHLKTTCVTVGGTIQRIMRNPNVRILIANIKLDNAKGILRQIKGQFERNEMLRWLIEKDLPDKSNKWTETEIIMNRETPHKEATVEAIGVGGAVVSKHYDVIFYDDVVDDDTVSTKEQIEKNLKWWQDTLSLLMPGGEVIVVGTRWHDKDLYGYIKENLDHYKVFERACTIGGVDINDVDAKPIFPFFSIEDLRQKRREQGSYIFNCQFMMNPIDPETATFRKEWIGYFIDEDLKKLELNTFMTIDPAISTDTSSDYSALVVCSVDEWNNVYVRETRYGHWRPNELIENIFSMYELWQPNAIGLEVVAFQKSLKYSLVDEMRERGVFLPLEELKTSTRQSKEMRIRGLQPRFENGTVKLKKNVMDELEDELLRFPIGKRDDVLDALAYQQQLWHKPKGVFHHKAKSSLRRRGISGGWTRLEPLTGY